MLLGELNLPDFCWKDETVGCKRFRRFLECVEENLLTLVIHIMWWMAKGWVMVSLICY